MRTFVIWRHPFGSPATAAASSSSASVSCGDDGRDDGADDGDAAVQEDQLVGALCVHAVAGLVDEHVAHVSDLPLGRVAAVDLLQRIVAGNHRGSVRIDP